MHRREQRVDKVSKPNKLGTEIGKFDKKKLEAAVAPEKGVKLLKSCRCCRANKTVCDAGKRSPLPCSYCAKRNLDCQFDVAKPANRDFDNIGDIIRLVEEMKCKLGEVVARKELILSKLVEKQLRQLQIQNKSVIHTKLANESVHNNKIVSVKTPNIHEIQSALFSPSLVLDQEKLCIDPIPTRSHSDSFTIHSDLMSKPHTISKEKAQDLFKKFQLEYCDFLPVLPESFFDLDLHHIYKESDLLFWTIIVTTYITHAPSEEYHMLAAHVQNLVVVNCWFNTPRLLYSLVAVLILTSWPLPNKAQYNIQDNIAIKYSSLMKSLALQFGLHKLKFIDEFSKKTNVIIDASKDVNNLICERIYKYVNINSNYWLVYLGLSNSNYNGFHQDYIINKAANFDLFKKEKFTDRDNFINSLLKISLIQLKMNQSMSDFLANPHKVGKLIHLNMFEQILTGYLGEDSPLYKHDLITLSVEFSKLQLYVYYLSESDISILEYKNLIMRTVYCCENIVGIFETRFGEKRAFQLIPVHFRFSIELAALVLLQIYSSPLLSTIENYIHTKKLFQRAHHQIEGGVNDKSLIKVLRICIDKVDKCNKTPFWAHKSVSRNFFLIDKMAKYLISASYYELLWQVYECECHCTGDEIRWETFMLNKENKEDQKIIQYFLASKSIFD